MAVEVPQNEEISGGGNNGGRKRVGSAICRRKAIRESININNRERGVVDSYIIIVGVKQRKRGKKIQRRISPV